MISTLFGFLWPHFSFYVYSFFIISVTIYVTFLTLFFPVHLSFAFNPKWRCTLNFSHQIMEKGRLPHLQLQTTFPYWRGKRQKKKNKKKNWREAPVSPQVCCDQKWPISPQQILLWVHLNHTSESEKPLQVARFPAKKFNQCNNK